MTAPLSSSLRAVLSCRYLWQGEYRALEDHLRTTPSGDRGAMLYALGLPPRVRRVLATHPPTEETSNDLSA